MSKPTAATARRFWGSLARFEKFALSEDLFMGRDIAFVWDIDTSDAFEAELVRLANRWEGVAA